MCLYVCALNCLTGWKSPTRHTAVLHVMCGRSGEAIQHGDLWNVGFSMKLGLPISPKSQPHLSGWCTWSGRLSAKPWQTFVHCRFDILFTPFGPDIYNIDMQSLFLWEHGSNKLNFIRRSFMKLAQNGWHTQARWMALAFCPGSDIWEKIAIPLNHV